jgi:CRP-like cAMP-binding protein
VALNQDIALLARVPLFARLDREALRLIAFSAESRVYRAGDIIFRKGDRSDGGYLITGGAVALDVADDGSPGAVIARTGSLIGELALVVDTLRPATAIVREPAGALKITRRMFRRVLEEYPDSASSLREELLARVGETAAGLDGVRRKLLAFDEDVPLTRRG